MGVDFFGDFSVFARPKNRARESVWVDELKVLGCKREPSSFISDLLWGIQQKRKSSRLGTP
jgi:hypothetical protein